MVLLLGAALVCMLALATDACGSGGVMMLLGTEWICVLVAAACGSDFACTIAADSLAADGVGETCVCSDFAAVTLAGIRVD